MKKRNLNFKDINYFHISHCLKCNGFACHIVLKNKDGIVICNHCGEVTFYKQKYKVKSIIEKNHINDICSKEVVESNPKAINEMPGL